jgi:NAD-dependent SIR2 family protein deacetylase
MIGRSTCGPGAAGRMLAWGYILTHANNVLKLPKHQTCNNDFKMIYIWTSFHHPPLLDTDLLKVLKSLDKEEMTWVVSSNVDSMFERNGFAKERIWCPQGDFRLLQCHERM